MTTTFEVRINGVLSGYLSRATNGRIVYEPDAHFADNPQSPTLGQQFLEDRRARHLGNRVGALPPFFANLLPQGAYRRLLDSEHQPQDDLALLGILGADLPGAVVIRPAEAAWRPVAPDPPPPLPAPQGGLRIKASLAGMQPKFSMSRSPRGFTLPAEGVDGDWIVKLPGELPRVPEVEQATMTWARAAGLAVPETQLVPVADLDGIPPQAGAPERLAFAIRRFDRPAPGHRIHQEDFAQVLGISPDVVVAQSPPKGTNRSHLAQARIIAALCPEDVDTFLRWLIFVVLSGNNDAHHKNLSLWYPDTRRARLAPAYDLLSQIVWPQFTPTLELHILGIHRFEEVDATTLLTLCRKAGQPRSESAVRALVTPILDAWSDLRSQLPLLPGERAAIEAHLARSPLRR